MFLIYKLLSPSQSVCKMGLMIPTSQDSPPSPFGGVNEIMYVKRLLSMSISSLSTIDFFRSDGKSAGLDKVKLIEILILQLNFETPK